MIRFTFLSLVAAAVLAISSTSQAQIYVPHTTTHIDLVPHRGHFDAVPFPSHSSNYGGGYGLGYNTGFGSSYSYTTGNNGYYAPQYGANYGSYYGGSSYSVQRPIYQNSYQHSSTHLDVVPHRGHYHVVPHTTTHRHRF